jgi:hypothetical protein
MRRDPQPIELPLEDKSKTSGATQGLSMKLPILILLSFKLAYL